MRGSWVCVQNREVMLPAPVPKVATLPGGRCKPSVQTLPGTQPGGRLRPSCTGNTAPWRGVWGEWIQCSGTHTVRPKIRQAFQKPSRTDGTLAPRHPQPSAGPSPFFATVFTTHTGTTPHGARVPKSPKEGAGTGPRRSRVAADRGTCGRGRGRADAEGKSRRQIKGGRGPAWRPWTRDMPNRDCPCPSPSAAPLQETPENSQSRPATVESQTPSQPQVGKAMRRRGPSPGRAGTERSAQRQPPVLGQ